MLLGVRPNVQRLNKLFFEMGAIKRIKQIQNYAATLTFELLCHLQVLPRSVLRTAQHGLLSVHLFKHFVRINWNQTVLKPTLKWLISQRMQISSQIEMSDQKQKKFPFLMIYGGLRRTATRDEDLPAAKVFSRGCENLRILQFQRDD